jgi:hypothetical protein
MNLKILIVYICFYFLCGFVYCAIKNNTIEMAELAIELNSLQPPERPGTPNYSVRASSKVRISSICAEYCGFPCDLSLLGKDGECFPEVLSLGDFLFRLEQDLYEHDLQKEVISRCILYSFVDSIDVRILFDFFEDSHRFFCTISAKKYRKDLNTKVKVKEAGYLRLELKPYFCVYDDILDKIKDVVLGLQGI